jgi:metallo-beta-lactamase family protein
MLIHFYGAAHDVTGSQYLIEVNDRRLLLECGLYQGRREESYERNSTFRFDPKSLDAVILSHAHIDHSGNLPNLVKQGFSGPIYTTLATARLADVLLRDSGNIQESDAEFISRIRRRRDLPPIQPIYTIADAEAVARHFRPVEYDQKFEPINGVSARLINAGHLLGSAAVCLDIQEPGGRAFRFWFSGDIGRRNLALVPDPILPDSPDYLMMECTYGDTRHNYTPEEAYERFREVVKETLGRGGKLIIPAFAVGRTQELVFALNQMIQSGELEPIPVYVDSPLAVEASRVYHKLRRFFDGEAQAFEEDEETAPLAFETLRYIRSVEDSKALVDLDEPMVVISASGMAETGRIVHHIRANISDPKNTILMVSWQAPRTLGARLLEGEQEVEIFDEIYPVRARIDRVEGFSAHAGQRMLLEYATANNGKVKQVILVHSEPETAAEFGRLLTESGGPPSVYPDLLDTITI